MDPFSVEQRRARLVTRHCLAGSASSTDQAAEAVVALHASDPATVFLSVLARASSVTLDDVTRSLYDERSLVRMMAMRRTLFVVPQRLVPVVHRAASLDVARTVRARLVRQLSTLPTDPPLPADVDGWLRETEAQVEEAILELGVASGQQLGTAVPRLRTAILPTTDKAYDVRRSLTSPILTLMALEARLVRGRPLGSWTSRQHTWEPASRWWPDGIPEVPDARAALVAAYLSRFGPATETDVAWWTGWPLGTTRAALQGAARTGELLHLPEDERPVEVPEPVAALLPALDPTTMGWKQRDWYQPEDSAPLYDRNGNAGPTVWWAGEVVGGWTVRDGRVVTRLLVDRGQTATEAVEEAAERLTARLDGRAVTPSFPTPLDRALREK